MSTRINNQANQANTANQATDTTSTNSSYSYQATSLAGCISAMLYLMQVQNQCKELYTEQVQNELNAQEMFTDAAADSLRDQGEDAMMGAIMQGSGQVLQGGVQIGSGFAMDSTTTAEEPEIETPNRNVELNEEAVQNSASESQVKSEESLQKQDELEKPKTKTRTRWEATRNSEALKGLGSALAGGGTIGQGIYQSEEKNRAADEREAELGQSIAKTMTDQYIQEINSVSSDIQKILSQIESISSAGTVK